MTIKRLFGAVALTAFIAVPAFAGHIQTDVAAVPQPTPTPAAASTSGPSVASVPGADGTEAADTSLTGIMLTVIQAALSLF